MPRSDIYNSSWAPHTIPFCWTTQYGAILPLCRVKMLLLWRTLHHFDIHLCMAYPSITPPREQDQVLMEIFHSQGLSRETTRSLNRCRVSLESIFLLDLTTADSRYLEEFVFNPGGRDWSSSFRFPRKVPTREDWNQWFDFWHAFTTTVNKLKAPPSAIGSTPHIASENGII